MSFKSFPDASPPPIHRANPTRTVESMSQTLGPTTGYLPASECRAPVRPTTLNNQTSSAPLANTPARRNLTASFDQAGQTDK